MNHHLERILMDTRERVAGLQPQRGELEHRAANVSPPRFFGGLAPDGSVGVIAEVKRRSPSSGAIHADLDPVAHARAYAAGGAVAISVLTEPQHFGGSLDDLQRVGAAVPVPVLCKDFILDELQLLAARAAGASAVLLIARILTGTRLRELIAAASRLELGVLVEVHSVDELDGAIAAGAAVVGVNNRDLDSFEVDLASGERVLRAVPRHLVAVSESGIESRADVERLAAAGADLVLVGTALVRLDDPRSAVHALCGVPRRPRGLAA
ncbi:MAG TPA: indole-3-glycerol phosphate synthase TrpC [Gemmatimonadales bacterium]|nr:indole-3-glycerol phosphate synthase TrpC [Gemmatimonadales bacterium]